MIGNIKLSAKVLVLIGLLVVSGTALANNQAKINVAKKAIQTGQVSPYATAGFKKLIKQANSIQFKIDEGLGCEMFEKYYLGHGQDPSIRNIEAFVLKDGTVLATFLNYDYRIAVHFKMVCNGSNCMIDDVETPWFNDYSLRKSAQNIINTHSCD